MITIDKNRLITNQELVTKDPELRACFSAMGINPSSNDLVISSGTMLIVDPTYLADIYNEDGEKEQYLKQNGVLLNDFGGDVGGPILRTQEGGILVWLVFDRMNSDGKPIFSPECPEWPDDEEVLFDGLGCDSGSYIFMDYRQELLLVFQQELTKYAHLCALVKMPIGRYRIGYEQWETDIEIPYEAWKRNLVAFPV